jgi:hypothetical protein
MLEKQNVDCIKPAQESVITSIREKSDAPSDIIRTEFYDPLRIYGLFEGASVSENSTFHTDKICTFLFKSLYNC